MNILDTYLTFAESLADDAGEIARKYFDTMYGSDIEIKDDQTPVTIADKEIEMKLVERIRANHPDHGIYGEETGKSNMDAEYVWVIDPIDGTKAFIGGRPTFATLIALCHNGKPVLGLIDQPIKRERWAAHSDRNTTMNGDVVTSSREDGLSAALVSTTSMGYFSPDQMMGFQALEHATRSTVLNHDGYAYGMLSQGDMDVVVDAKMKPYDFCALVPVVEMAGGKITDYAGNLVDIHSNGAIIACANEALFDKVLPIITKSC